MCGKWEKKEKERRELKQLKHFVACTHICHITQTEVRRKVERWEWRVKRWEQGHEHSKVHTWARINEWMNEWMMTLAANCAGQTKCYLIANGNEILIDNEFSDFPHLSISGVTWCIFVNRSITFWQLTIFYLTVAVTVTWSKGVCCGQLTIDR